MNITLDLTVDEVNAILQTLGNLPTSSGAFPLLVKVKQQAEKVLGSDTESEAE